MANYTPQTWVDGPGGGTPISAARLNTLEAGAAAALASADASSTYAQLAGVVFAPAPSGDTTGATDTAALQAAINGLADSAVLWLWKGTYYINAALTISQNIRVFGQGIIALFKPLLSGGTDFDMPLLSPYLRG